MNARTEHGTEVLDAADVRFGQVGIANIRVRNADPALLGSAITARVREAPALFERAPVVVDLSFLTPRPAADATRAMLAAIRDAGMLPVGLAYGDDATDALARQLELPLVAKFRAAYERAAQPVASRQPEPAAPAPVPAVSRNAEPVAALQHHQPVRTGQQVYAQGSDLIVVGAVAAGAEVLADGNIHIYGSLRGRAFAGALGDKSARIFCSEFRAEIVSIAGHYRVFEELPGELAGHAVQIHLEHDKLQVTAL